MGAILALLTGFLTFAVGSAFPGSVFKTTSPVQKTFYGRCFSVEANEKLVILKEDLDNVHDQYPKQPFCDGLIGAYTRVRRKVSIISGKLNDEEREIRGGCATRGSDMRLVGMKGDKLIYWLDNNYKYQDLRDFIEVNTGGSNNDGNFLSTQVSDSAVFDVYAKDEILNKMPDYVINCDESGGLVPVVEGESGIRPPQVVPIKNIDISLFKKNFEKTVLKQNTSFPPYKNYLIKIDKQNLPAEALPDGQIGVYTTPRVKNEMYAYDVIYHLGAFYLRDKIDGTTYVYGTSTEGPPQNLDNNPSLQLGRLWFRVVDSWTAFTPNCKPAIYLYPQKPQDINVKLGILGDITVSDPKYNPETGWNVKALPDGTLNKITDNRQQITNTYSYLYYEAMLVNGYKPKDGWIISRENIKDQLKAILNSVGLNDKERDDFLEYWLPRLVSKPYYFTGLVPVSEIDKQEILTINPSPSNIIRVRLIFEGLDYPISVSSPKLANVKREGFTVVDWGGTLVGQSCEGKKIQ